MAGYTYLCPSTRIPVQAFTAEAITANANIYEPVTCIMCQKVHYVNPFTGKLLGAEGRRDTLTH
jgi:hypothetical protein